MLLHWMKNPSENLVHMYIIEFTFPTTFHTPRELGTTRDTNYILPNI